MKVDHPQWRKRTSICRCAVCAISVLAVAVSLQPAVARHGRHHAFHGVRHSRHEQDYAPPYSEIVLDANSGKVLHADKADEPRHPASLTKIMTLYLLFERLEAGKIRLDSQIPVSEHASEQAPTKLGLKPGQTIEVEDAIRGLVTKSANDAAVAVAEALGGTEQHFAEMMTAKARELGMTHTFYHNASGLPDDEQITTARDEAILGRAIQDRFPRYYHYFSTPSFTWHGEVLRNHNHLLGQVEGMDGIKTGFTQASGFNLVASVRRNGRHIVSVVLGGTSAAARDARMRSLIEDYIDEATPQKNMMIASAAAAKANAMRKEEARKAAEARKDEARLNALVRSATAGPANTGSKDAPASNGAAATGSGTYSVASAATEPIKPIEVKTLKVRMAPAAIAALAPEALTPPPASDETKNDAKSGAKKKRSEAKSGAKKEQRDLIAEAIHASVQERNRTPSNAGAPAEPPLVHTGWMIQVGAFDVEQEARERLSLVRAKAGRLLKHASPYTEPVTSGDKTFYRARFAGIQKDQAEAACKKLKRNDIACMAIKN